MDEEYGNVQPLHHKAKDTFFKKVYESYLRRICFSY